MFSSIETNVDDFHHWVVDMLLLIWKDGEEKLSVLKPISIKESWVTNYWGYYVDSIGKIMSFPIVNEI